MKDYELEVFERIAGAMERIADVLEKPPAPALAPSPPPRYAIGDMHSPKTGIWYAVPTEDIQLLIDKDPLVEFGRRTSYYIYCLHEGKTIPEWMWDEADGKWKVF